MQSHPLSKTVSLLRRLMIEALQPGESHHIGCAFSILEIVTVLYYKVMKIDPQNPKDSERDIFILSKGHAALAVYAVLCDKGFITKEQFMTYDKNGSVLPEHMSTAVRGVEVSTGSLGHGLPIGVGFALSAKRDKKTKNIYVLMSDGELNEGSNWEAIQFAAHHQLSNLVAIVDLNGFQGYAETQHVIDLSPLADKFKAFKWNVYDVAGHDTDDLEKVFEQVKNKRNEKPTLIIAKTQKGHGMPFFEGAFESHYQSVDEQMKEKMLLSLEKTS